MVYAATCTCTIFNGVLLVSELLSLFLPCMLSNNSIVHRMIHSCLAVKYMYYGLDTITKGSSFGVLRLVMYTIMFSFTRL